MALVINTNVASLEAQKNVNKTSMNLQNSLKRLSSGLRINSAKDDAAGSAISNRMTAQIRGLDQAVRNSNDGISLAQTAEGALNDITSNLQRLRELAVQSANGSNSDDDRKALQLEAAQLLEAINTSSKDTEFNGMKLLDGSFVNRKFQVGSNVNQTLGMSITSASTKDLGTSDTAALTAVGTTNGFKAGDLTINGTAIRATSAGDDTASYPSSSKAASAIAKAAAINASSAETGVYAKADVNTSAGATMKATAGSGKLTINGVQTSLITTSTDASSSRVAVAAAINAISGQTGVVATDSGSDNKGVVLTAADGRNVTVEFSAPQSGTFDASTTGVRTNVENVQTGAAMIAATAAQTGFISINGEFTTQLSLGNTDMSANRKAVVKAINDIAGKTGVIAEDTGADGTGIKLKAADGRKIVIGYDTAGKLTDAMSGLTTGTKNAATTAGTYYGSYTLFSNKEIVVTGNKDMTNNTGLTAGSYKSQTAFVSTSKNNGLAMTAGDVEINGVMVGASLATSDTFSRYSASVSATDVTSKTAASAIAKTAAINAVSEVTGVTAEVNTNVVKGASMTSGTAGVGTMWINGVQTQSISVSGGSVANRATDRAAVVEAINKISDQTGVVAIDTNEDSTGIRLEAKDGRNIDVQFASGLGKANTGIGATASQTVAVGDSNATFNAAVAFTLNGVSISSGGVALTAQADAIALLNNYTSQTGVTASADASGGLKLTAANGQKIDFGTDMAAADDLGFTGTTNAEYAGNSVTNFGTYTLSSAAKFDVDKGTTANIANSGLEAGTYGSGKSGMALKDLDLSTVEGANKALEAIDNALKSVDDSKSNLGALQNRFDATVTNLANISVNLSAARGRITDADFASETAGMTKYQILQQAGTAMLAQANQLPQSVLSLLQG